MPTSDYVREIGGENIEILKDNAQVMNDKK